MQASKPLQLLSKACIYVLLLAGAALFLVPLLWMFSTALKPLDQTMSLPPSFIPYRFHTEIAGELVSVQRGRTFARPVLQVRTEEGRVELVEAAAIEDGRWANPDDPRFGQEVTVLDRIAASDENPWMEVRPEDRPDHAWLFVPVDRVERSIGPRWANFQNALAAMRYFPRYLTNTLILCVLTVVGTVLSCSLAAYGFSRIAWRGRDKVFLLALATMMIPFPVIMVPVYTLFRQLGWIGTLRPLWVSSFFANAFSVFLLRQFFLTIPKDLSDAARIDGCSEFRIYWQIMLPLCKPALMVVALFQFMYTWNDFLGPLIYLTDQKDFTLALGLQFFQSQQGGTEWHYLMAASTVVILPIIILFFFTQRTFIEGISMTGLKG